MSRREEHDTFLRKLIQWLGLLRNMSCSSCVCGILLDKGARKADSTMALYGGGCYGLLHIRDLGRKKRHKATTRKGVPQFRGGIYLCFKL